MFVSLLLRRLILFVIFASTLSYPAFGARVALVVAEDPDLAATLVSDLSKLPDISILDRNLLGPLQREAISSGQPVRLEGADFLLFVEKSSETRSARLVDARSGAVIGIFRLPKGITPQLTTYWISARIRPLLALTADAPIRKFSLLGLRFESDTPSQRLIERELNLALAAALQASPKTTVLERWKLNDLVFEREIGDAGDSAFWSSAAILDGSISRDGGSLSVRLRQRNPEATGESFLEARGTIDRLDVLANELAERILQEEKLPDIPLPAEAKSYDEEARWLMRHGLKKDAVQAAETAVALGGKTAPAEALRLRAYANCAYPENLDPQLVQTGESPFVETEVTTGNLAESIAMATALSDLAASYAERFGATEQTKKRNPDHPIDLGVRTLPVSLSVLRSAHKQEFWKKDPEAILSLRAAIKRHIAATGKLPLANKRTWLDTRSAFFRHLIVFSGYWNDTPEDSLTFLTRALSPDFAEECPGGPALARLVLRQQSFALPGIPSLVPAGGQSGKPADWKYCRLIDWSDLGSPEPGKLWNEFVKGLESSPSSLKKSDGLMLHWTSSSTPEEMANVQSLTLGFLKDHLEDLYGADGAKIWANIRPILSRGYNDKNIQQTVLDAYRTVLASKRPAPEGFVGALGHFVKTDVPVSEGEGRQLLAVIESYDAFLGAGSSPTAQRETKSARNAIFRVHPSLEPRSQDVFPVTRTWLFGPYDQTMDRRSQGFFDPESGTWYEGRLWFLNGTNRKIWKIDPATLRTEIFTGKDAPTHVDDRKVFGGGSNLRDRNSRPLFASKKIFLPEQGDIWVYRMMDNTWRPMKLPDAHYSLWLVGEKVYATFGERSDGRETLRGEGAGVYEIDPEKETARLICNTRRRPAEHPLDEAKGERPFCMLPGHDGSALVGYVENFPSFYRLENGKPEPLFAKNVLTDVISRQGETLFPHFYVDKKYILRGIQRVKANGEMETLIWSPDSAIPAPSPPVWRYPEPIPDTSETNRRIEFRVAMWGEDLLLLVCTVATPQPDLFLFRRGQLSPIRLTLDFQLTPKDADTMRKFHYVLNGIENPAIGPYGLVTSPAGLAITRHAMPGFWFIPWAELEAQEKESR